LSAFGLSTKIGLSVYEQDFIHGQRLSTRPYQLNRGSQWHEKGKAPVRFEGNSHGHVSPVMRHRAASPCRITTLKLSSCAITGPHAEWLAGGVLAQCPAPVIDQGLISVNIWIKAAGAESVCRSALTSISL
jgi:hypothetical protein